MSIDASAEARLDEACGWAARLPSDDADWLAFTAWLEADPANAAAYDQVAMLEADVDALIPDLRISLPANDPGEAPPARWWLPAAGLATAAAIAALVVAPMLRPSQAPPVAVYATGSVGGRTVQFVDGSSVRLDRRTTVRVTGGAAPRIELAAGAAYFDIRHDPARQLVVTAGGYEVRDIGTKFDIAHFDGGVSVAVAEGSVEVAAVGSAAGQPVHAGERFDLVGESRVAQRSPVDPASVAGWRDGRLTYQNAPLTLVVADVSRYAGHRVVADQRVANLRFSGVIEIGDGTRLVERLQQFLPVDASEHGNETRLVPRRRR